jgi:hypothetical protein
METAMFTIGALSMVWAATAALAIYGVVMVLKLKDELKLTHKMIDDVYSSITTVDRAFKSATDHLHSYVDRRFDKLIDTHLSVKETEKKSKQIING